jgi:ActR/RegA family two-component response regulator
VARAFRVPVRGPQLHKSKALENGYSANGPAKEAIKEGASRFVSKPYDVMQMLQTVRCPGC